LLEPTVAIDITHVVLHFWTFRFSRMGI